MSEFENDPRFARAVECFQFAHREDPRCSPIAGETVPYSVHYHQLLAARVALFAPDASVALALASHCQHIRRWTIPRSSYEEGRTGYKRWRSALARFHADEAGRILRDVGYEEATIARVGSLLMKERLKSDPEVQALEDAICMVFLELELADFMQKHDDDKLVEIVKKTWVKMSPVGHSAALSLVKTLPDRARAILDRALA